MTLDVDEANALSAIQVHGRLRRFRVGYAPTRRGPFHPHAVLARLRRKGAVREYGQGFAHYAEEVVA